MKNMLRLIAIYMGSIIALTSCEKYEDPTTDYDYSAVYFGTQKPLRTIVAKEEMKFKFGAVLGGKRENSGEWVKFSVDPSLLKKNRWCRSIYNASKILLFHGFEK